MSYHGLYSEVGYLNFQLNFTVDGKKNNWMHWMRQTLWDIMWSLQPPHVLGTCWMNTHLSPEIEEQYFQLWIIVYSEWATHTYGGKGALFLPTALPCAFIFGKAVMKRTALMRFPHRAQKFIYFGGNSTWMESWSSFPPRLSLTMNVAALPAVRVHVPVHLSSSVCFLSVSPWQSDSTDTHSHPSTL